MAQTYQIKVQATSSEGKKRTLTFSPVIADANYTETLNEFAQKLQPLLTDSITSVSCYAIKSVDEYQSTVPVGIDAIPDSTKDSTIFKLANATGKKTVTLANSASAAQSDTTAFEAYATAVYEFGDQLSGLLEGDYAVDDVTLRAIFDYEVEQP